MRTLDRRGILRYRMRGHHLDAPLAAEDRLAAAGACGLLNSPPGTWEHAMLVRVKGIGAEEIRKDLTQRKTLIQAWGIRGIPCIFPAKDSPVFLQSLIPTGEEPWIYTEGVSGALDRMQMGFDPLLELVRNACAALDQREIHGKRELDRFLAGLIRPQLQPAKQVLWDSPSMYGPGQTTGEAAVSFLLRPCALEGRVVFGERKGVTPAFTSPRRWLGRLLEQAGDSSRGELARRFLRCYGPATPAMLASFLGCSPRQADRLWKALPDDLEQVIMPGGRKGFLLRDDAEAFSWEDPLPEETLLLPPHDPYLDMQDREILVPDKGQRQKLWKIVGNPGAVLRSGEPIGIWRPRTKGDKLFLDFELWNPLANQGELERLAGQLAEWKGKKLAGIQVL